MMVEICQEDLGRFEMPDDWAISIVVPFSRVTVTSGATVTTVS